MKNIIFLTHLNLWSIGEGKGALSFYKTIEAYTESGWNVILINPKYNIGYTPNKIGVENITFKPIFLPITKVKYIGLIGRVLHSLQGEYKLYKLGKKILEEYGGEGLIYSYEVHGVKAGKKLSAKYKSPFITRFQGTVLAPLKNSFLNRIRRYPHFGAISTSADLTIMTDDGTQGDQVIERLDNESKEFKFWRNGTDIKEVTSISRENMENLKKKIQVNSSDKVLITVSRLASWKRVDRAIKALSEISKYRNDIKLVIVGDGDEKENLRELAKRLNIIDKVYFAGSIKQSEVKSYLEIADVFLSLYDLSNVGNPLLEAMSCGKPIITLDIGDTRSIIKDDYNGILLRIDKLDKLPSKIIGLLDNESYANRLGSNAKKYAEDEFWSWDERMHAELKIVNKLYQKYYGNNNV